MSNAQPTPFDASAFEKLLSNVDASVLSPLFDRALQSIQEFANSGDLDFAAAQFSAHKLKTTCLQLGLPRLANILQSVEQSARNSDQARYDALKRMFDSEFTNVEKGLEEYGQKLRLLLTTSQ